MAAKLMHSRSCPSEEQWDVVDAIQCVVVNDKRFQIAVLVSKLSIRFLVAGDNGEK